MTSKSPVGLSLSQFMLSRYPIVENSRLYPNDRTVSSTIFLLKDFSFHLIKSYCPTCRLTPLSKPLSLLYSPALANCRQILLSFT
jgi:hypothetical protein